MISEARLSNTIKFTAFQEEKKKIKQMQRYLCWSFRDGHRRTVSAAVSGCLDSVLQSIYRYFK